MMKVTEIKNKLTEEDPSNQSVEFVVDGQKYFIHDLEKSTKDLTFVVTRKTYKAMCHSELERALSSSNLNADCFILNMDKSGEKKPVTALFKNGTFIELVSS